MCVCEYMDWDVVRVHAGVYLYVRTNVSERTVIMVQMVK